MMATTVISLLIFYSSSAMKQAAGFFIFGQYTHGLASTSNAEGGPRIYHRAYGISFWQIPEQEKDRDRYKEQGIRTNKQRECRNCY